MLDISFWLRFPLLLDHPAFVAAAIEECRAVIQNTEVRLAQWKKRFTSVSENPNSTLEDLSVCSEEFTALAVWIDKETMRVFGRALAYSYTIVKSAWTEAMKTESFDRLAGLHLILRAASEHCRHDLSQVKGPEREALQKLSSLVTKVLVTIRKQVEELYPEDLSKLEAQASQPLPDDAIDVCAN